MGSRYIYNRHIAPITANARDGKGRVVFTKKFQPESIDSTTGRIVHTGYTTLSEEEYKLLNESSRTFAVYRDKYKLLVEYDDLPPEAKTPQEALLDARKEGRKAAARVSALEDEIVKLKAALLDAETRYSDLQSMSEGGAKFQLISDKVTSLVQELAEAEQERDALRAENGELKKTAEKAEEAGKGKEFD